MKMTPLAADKDYSLFRDQGWTDWGLVAAGYAYPPDADTARLAWLSTLLYRPDRWTALVAAMSLGKIGHEAVDYAMEGSS